MKTNKWKKRQKQLRIACWNVKSLNKKDQEIINEMNQHQIDICAVSETKKRGKGTTQLQNYILIYSGKGKNSRATSGVPLLINEKYKNNITNINYVNDRILITTIEIESEQCHIISVYAPDAGKPENEAQNFFDQLQAEIDRIDPQEKLILMGDLNARVGNEIIEGIKQRYNEPTINERGEMLIDLCTNNELRINNTFFPHKEQHKITFMGNRDAKSIIDYIITNRAITPNHIIDVRSLTSANIGSDHNLVLCKLRITIPPYKDPTPTTTKKYNIEAFMHDSTKDLYKRRLQQNIDNNKITDEDNIEESWIKIKTNIYTAAEEAIGSRTVNTNAKQKSKPWFTQEIKEITAKKKQAYLQCKSNPTPETHTNYNAIRNQVNSRVRQIKEEYWDRFSTEMENDIYGTQKRVWKILRGLKREINETVQINSIHTEEWVNYFEALHKQTQQPKENSTPTTEQITETRLHLEDVEKTIKKLKNRKSPGEDNIVNELIKYGDNALAQELTKLFNKILKSHRIPTDWKKGITIPIFKKGNKKDPANYRGITLLDTTGKLFTKILAEKISETIHPEDEQQGFRQNRSTVDAIFIIRQILEKALEYNTPAYMCFIDLTKAFDRIQLHDVLKIMQDEGVDPNYIRTIEEINKNTTTQLKIKHKLTREIQTQTGIRQGDSISPLLFNLIMNKIIQAVKTTTIGYRLGNTSVNIICYADDAVLIAESEDDLQRLLHRFNQQAEQLNMIISTSKTQCMTISKEPLRCKLVIKDHPIEQVMSFKYLGVRICSYGDLTSDVQQQTNKASRISGCLKNTIWKNKSMSVECKTRIYKACIRPVMAYAAESRADTTRTKRLLRTTEMRSLRTITGNTLLDRRRNNDIREQCGVEDIVRWTRKRRRLWNEHIDRMPVERVARIARSGIPRGRRPAGRPPKRWRDSWQSASQEPT